MGDLLELLEFLGFVADIAIAWRMWLTWAATAFVVHAIVTHLPNETARAILGTPIGIGGAALGAIWEEARGNRR